MKKDGKGEATIQGFLERAGMEAALKTPFDRVRIVSQAEDIISPDLLPEEPEVVPVVKVSKKRKAQTASAGPKLAKKSKIGNKGQTGSTSPKKDVAATDALKIKLKMPQSTNPASPAKQQKLPQRMKEVDSDGDIVGDWSDDDGVVQHAASLGSRSDLTPLSSRSPTPPRRLAFPPRVSSDNLPPTLHAVAGNGFINPVMMHSTLAPPEGQATPLALALAPVPTVSPSAATMSGPSA